MDYPARPHPASNQGAVAASPGVALSVFATGLNNPRGLKFGPDGNLYVAEGGTGGLNDTVGVCDQAAGVGPYTANVTGARISRIDRHGFRTTVVDNLPSSQTNADTGSLISGVGDIAFVGNTPLCRARRRRLLARCAEYSQRRDPRSWRRQLEPDC